MNVVQHAQLRALILTTGVTLVYDSWTNVQKHQIVGKAVISAQMEVCAPILQ